MYYKANFIRNRAKISTFGIILAMFLFKWVKNRGFLKLLAHLRPFVKVFKRAQPASEPVDNYTGPVESVSTTTIDDIHLDRVYRHYYYGIVPFDPTAAIKITGT